MQKIRCCLPGIDGVTDLGMDDMDDVLDLIEEIEDMDDSVDWEDVF